MRDAARHHHHPAGPDLLLAVADAHEDLALEEVRHLVRVRVAVERGHLALRHVVLEEVEGAAGLFGGGLPGVRAAAEEPPLLAFAVGPDDRVRWAHENLLLLVGTAVGGFMGSLYHDEITVP